uniref:Uncharacterized protein n=1 Tax=Paramormyrops kingsleyae TaxID=1676925 RepID=A0A3B3QZT3_9TELE
MLFLHVRKGARSGPANLVNDYISETLKYIEAVQVFLDKESEWFCKREEEMNKMKDIRKKANNMSKLEKELSAVVKDLTSGLKELQPFLEALEKLAVTSPFVFDKRLCWFPAGNTVTDVISFIHAARMSCGLLVYFRKDTKKIFQPNLDNVEILAFELQRMTGFSKDICAIMEERSLQFTHCLFTYLKRFSPLRANEHFRLAFMFGDEEKSLKFIDVLREQKPKILRSLTQMEACAVQLDEMKMELKIFSVVGGGVLTIVGLALAKGLRTPFTLFGGVLGAAVNSVTIGITELAVNAHEGQKFIEIYQNVLQDSEPICKFLDQVMIFKGPSVENDTVDHMTEAGTVNNVYYESMSDVCKAIQGHVDFCKIHLDAWQRICDSLHRGKQDFQETRPVCPRERLGFRANHTVDYGI